MKIQINTGPNTDGSGPAAQQVEAIIENTLGHLAERVSRVEVHLSDQNSIKRGSADQRCLLEARLEGCQPIAVSEDAGSMTEAVTGAAEKLKHAIENILDRLNER